MANAASLYWDANGILGGSGTWDVNATTNWRTVGTVGAPDSTWTPNDGTVDAFFAEINNTATVTAHTVTIPAATTINANSLTFNTTFAAPGTTARSFFVTGGTLQLSPTRSVTMPTNTGTGALVHAIGSVIGGTDFVVYNPNSAAGTGRTLLNLVGANTFTGNLILDGASPTTPTSFNAANQVSISKSNSLPATASVIMKRNFSQLSFTAGSAVGGGNTAYTQTFNNNINLNGSGSGTFTGGIGAGAAGTVATLGGVISGNANLTFGTNASGGGGGIVLANNATYTGNTVMQLASSDTTSGFVRLGVDNALPTTTTLTLGNTAGAPSGTFDMAGKSQTLKGLASLVNTTTFAGHIGGITNTTNTLSTLTIDGNATTTYGVPAAGASATSANIGTAISAGITGSTNRIALNLASTNTGQLTLIRPTGNTYDGGTTINGGTLLISNTSGSGTGSAGVSVGPNGKFGSGVGTVGIVSGAVDNAGTLLPGGAGGIGTFTLGGALTGQAGSNINFDFNGSSNDKLAINGSQIAVPSGTVNLKLFDLTSTAFTNTTYTIADGNFAGFNTALFNVVKPTSGTASFANFTLLPDATGLRLSVSGVGTQLAWRGDLADGNGVWDTGTTANFVNGSSAPSTFASGDVVTFDDAANPASGTTPITVTVDAAGVSPGNIAVNNNSRDYTITGGSINGGASITKGTVGGNATAKLTLTGVNHFTGGVTVNSGMLSINSDAALGDAPTSPTINLTLNKTASTNNTFLLLDENMTLNANRIIKLSQTGSSGPRIAALTGKSITINGDITGATGGVNAIFGDVTLPGYAGTIYLRGNNGTNVGGGFVNAMQIKAGTVNVISESNFFQSGTNITFNATNGVLQFGASFPWSSSRTLNFSTSADGNGGSIDTNGFDEDITAVVSGNGSMTKLGAGTLTLSAANTFTGTTTVSAGTLAFAKQASLYNNTPASWTDTNITVNSGSTLALAVGGAGEFTSGDVDTIKALGTATGGFKNGSKLGLNTATADFTYSSTIANPNSGANALGVVKLGGNTLTLTAANTYTGGTTVSAGTLVLGNADATAAGAIDVANGALARAQASLPKAVTVSTLNTNASGKLDLTNNSMVVKSMTDSAVRTQLQAGYNAGAWNGPTGIVSTGITAETSIGYATKLQTGITDFKGVTGMADTDVQVKFTYAGDANLDGKVDIGDLGLLAGAWQATSGKVWFDGDFTYDGKVDIGDLGLLSGNWQKGTAGNPNPPLMDFATAMAQFSAFDGVVVPEPASLGLLGVAGIGLLARRRRR